MSLRGANGSRERAPDDRLRDDPSTLAAQATPGWQSAEAPEREGGSNPAFLSRQRKLDCFASLAMTGKGMHSRSHGADSPELCRFVVPLLRKGAGKAGRLPHPQPRVR